MGNVDSSDISLRASQDPNTKPDPKGPKYPIMLGTVLMFRIVVM